MLNRISITRLRFIPFDLPRRQWSSLMYFFPDVVWQYVQLSDIVDDDCNHRLSSNRIFEHISYPIDVNKHVFEHNFDELFDRNMWYIDRVKREIFHVVSAVEPKRRSSDQ